MKNLITLTDEQLIKLFNDGEITAMEMLVNRHKERIFTSIYLLVKDKYLAEDIFQDLFIKIIETLKAGKYKEENKFVQWAMRIAHNLCVDHFRKIKNKPVIRTSEGTDIFDVLHFDESNAEDRMMKMQSNETIMKLVWGILEYGPRFTGRNPPHPRQIRQTAQSRRHRPFIRTKRQPRPHHKHLPGIWRAVN
jgi:RNA polymerase sigma-70 factor (ECF subfamily)